MTSTGNTSNVHNSKDLNRLLQLSPGLGINNVRHLNSSEGKSSGCTLHDWSIRGYTRLPVGGCLVPLMRSTRLMEVRLALGTG